MQTLLRIKTYVAILPIMLLMLLLPDTSWSQTPSFQLRGGSDDNQSLCQTESLTPIYYDVRGNNVTDYSITRITKQGIDVTPDIDNIPGIGFNLDLGAKHLIISGRITEIIRESTTFVITIRPIGSFTGEAASTSFTITMHPEVDEHQILRNNTNCAPPYNTSVTILPGDIPGEGPWTFSYDGGRTWLPPNGCSIYDGTGECRPSFTYSETTKPEIQALRLWIRDKHGCYRDDASYTTADVSSSVDIYLKDMTFSQSFADNCNVTIDVNNSREYIFNPQNPSDIGQSFPIVYILKKKNENGEFVEVERKRGEAAKTTFIVESSGIYAVTAIFDTFNESYCEDCAYGDTPEKPWSNCSYDLPLAGFPTIKEVIISGAPQIFELTAPDGNTYCDEGTGSGADLQLSGSETGTSYQLYRDGEPIGSPIQGTDLAIDFGKQTEGLYTVIATKPGCTVDMAGEITITKKDAPTAPEINIPDGGLSYCKGTDGAEVIVTNAYNGVTYTLYQKNGDDFTEVENSAIKYDGSNSVKWSVTEGEYKVQATNSNGCSSESQSPITISALELPETPTVESNSLSFCNGGNAEIKVTKAVSGINYSLFKKSGDDFSEQIGNTIDGSDSDNVKWSVTEGGEYKVRATNSNGCSSESATITATKNDLPAAPDLTDEYRACQSDGEFMDLANLTIGNLGNCKVTWYDNDMNPLNDTKVSLSVDGEFSYCAKLTNENGCQGPADCINIIVGAKSASPVVSDYDGCVSAGESIDLNDLVSLNNNDLHWSDSKGDPLTTTVIPLDNALSDTYYVYNINNCPSDEVAVKVNIKDISAAPTVNTDYVEDGTFEICAGESQSITLTTLIENGDALNLTWYKDAQLTEIVPDDEIDVDLSNEKDVTYYVTNTETDKCPSAAVPVRILVKVNASVPSIDVVDADGFAYNDCKKDGRFDLNDLVSSSQNDLAWFDSDMQTITDETFDMSVPGSTSYFVSAVSADGCQSATVEVKVNIKDIATTADITADDMEVCTGASATLTAATSISDNDLVFTWYDDADLQNVVGTGATLQITGPDAQATYYVTVKGDNTCENQPGDAAEAAVYAIAPIDNVRLEPVEERIGMGKETEKTLTVEPTDAYHTAVWTANGQVIAAPDSYFPAKPYSDVEYKVVVTDECGNEMEASAITKVVWPTIITPQNVDGKNDDFLVGMQEDIHLEIFDRWGNVVFSGNDGWSQAEAAKQQPGVYYYIATLPDGSIKQGTVEIYK